MLYIIGLGLNEKGVSKEGLETVRKCSQVYLENYTVEFPYSVGELRQVVGKRVVELKRDEVESEKLVKEAKCNDVALLVYGSPLFATTHISLIDDCKEKRVKFKIIYSAGVFDALGESGLQLYKFGKISSMPRWSKGYEPDSFLEFVEENQKINAHSLILMDIGLGFCDALCQFVESAGRRSFEFDKILICSRLGSDKAKFFYGKVNDLKKKKVYPPFCFVIPAKMHFLEEDVVKEFVAK